MKTTRKSQRFFVLNTLMWTGAGKTIHRIAAGGLAVGLPRDAEWLYAGMNILVSVALCLISVWLDHLIATQLNR